MSPTLLLLKKDTPNASATWSIIDNAIFIFVSQSGWPSNRVIGENKFPSIIQSISVFLCFSTDLSEGIAGLPDKRTVPF